MSSPHTGTPVNNEASPKRRLSKQLKASDVEEMNASSPPSQNRWTTSFLANSSLKIEEDHFPAVIKYTKAKFDNEEFKINNFVSDGNTTDTDVDQGQRSPGRERKRETAEKGNPKNEKSTSSSPSPKKKEQATPKEKIISLLDSPVDNKGGGEPSSMSSVTPILKERVEGKPGLSKRLDRKDTMGNQIGEGHKIVFAEEISVVHEVESWKEYNLRQPPPKNACCEVF